MSRQTMEMLNRVMNRGISFDDALALRRISMTLQRWHELECGTGTGYCVERDESGKPWMRNYDRGGRGWRIADREFGALKRLAKIMARYPKLRAYVQGDPRGAALYIYRADALPAGTDIDTCYSSIGTAIYK